MSTPTRRYWPRYLGAFALIVLLSGVATAYSSVRTLDCLVEVCGDDDLPREGDEPLPDPPEKLEVGPLVEVPPGQPQTLLLIGSDRRSKKSADAAVGAAEAARSDTMMLLHLDAKRGGAVMSIPRDTAVDIPGRGRAKINEAFTLGGPKLTVQTVQNLLDIPINGVVEINFGAFERAVNRLDCLYEDIDRSYFNDNSTGSNYATIDVKAGYQLLCGADTLDWVRFRHADNDLVRGARQQEFLRSAKSQVAVSKLLSSGNDLVRIFKSYTRTTVQGGRELLTLMKLAISAGEHQLRSVRFRAYDEPGTGNLTVSARDLGIMKREFERLEGSSGQTTSTATKKTKGKTAKKATTQRKGLATGLVRVADETTNPALQKASFELAAKKLPVYYPGIRLAVGGYADRDPVRTYAIRKSRYSKMTYPAFRLTFGAGEGKYFGQYYGLQGTTWKDAPILKEAHTVVNRRGRTLKVYKSGSRTRIVAWVTDDGAYWVSNSLSLALTNAQMLDIASSFTRVPG